MTPAEYVITVFGGVRAVARAIDQSPSSVSRWRKPRNEKGCDGEIPRGARKPILKAARESGLDVTSHDLDFGRKPVRKRVA